LRSSYIKIRNWTVPTCFGSSSHIVETDLDRYRWGRSWPQDPRTEEVQLHVSAISILLWFSTTEWRPEIGHQTISSGSPINCSVQFSIHFLSNY